MLIMEFLVVLPGYMDLGIIGRGAVLMEGWHKWWGDLCDNVCLHNLMIDILWEADPHHAIVRIFTVNLFVAFGDLIQEIY